MVTKKLMSLEDFTERRLAQGLASLAANAGSSQVLGLSVPVNRQLVVSGIVRASAGVLAGAIAVTVANGTDTLAAGAAHGYTGVVPCFVKGTGQPGGVTASTIYYAWPSSATEFQLYDTMANALVHNGSTGLIDITTDGSAVTLTPTVVTAVWQVFGAVANRNGNTAVLGSPVVDSLEVVAAWDCTVAADDTNDLLQVKVTPDTALVTKVEYLLSVYDLSLAV